MNAGEKLRVFAALQPPIEWLEEMRKLQEKLQAALPSKAIRWGNPAHLHVTLRFFGSIVRQQLAELTGLIETGARDVRSFQLRCEGVGTFPRPSNPRVIWAGLSGEVEACARLQGRVSDLTAHIGQPPETRAFKPHLTLARVQNLESRWAGALKEVLTNPPAIAAPAWQVKEIRLMESHLNPSGARYEELFRAPLGNVT